MKDIVLSAKHLPKVTIGASVSFDTGRPIVEFRCGDYDESSLTPAEARRMARALVKAAECCDKKSASTKGR